MREKFSFQGFYLKIKYEHIHFVTAEVGGPSTHWVVCNLRPFDIEVGVSMLVWTVRVCRSKITRAHPKIMTPQTSVA